MRGLLRLVAAERECQRAETWEAARELAQEMERGRADLQAFRAEILRPRQARRLAA